MIVCLSPALDRRAPAAYHCGRCARGGPQPIDRRKRMAVSGTSMPVGDSPQTRASLLVQIRDGSNRGAWQEFVKLYGPVVYGFPPKRGLQDAAPADLLPAAMLSL